MAIVAGVNIPDNKRVEISLRHIYGIGPTQAKDVVQKASIEENPRVKDLSEAEKFFGSINLFLLIWIDMELEFLSIFINLLLTSINSFLIVNSFINSFLYDVKYLSDSKYPST